MRRLTAGLVTALAATPAAAHEGHRHTIGWTLSPDVLIPLLLALILYLVGHARLANRAGRGRERLAAQRVRFLAGWAILAGALVSPLHEAGEVSFTLHMVEHELIMLPAALLLVAARPGATLMWGLPAPLRQTFAPVVRMPVWRWLSGALVATALQGLALIFWHLPALFDRALRVEGWHVVQHLSFITTALLFWHAVLPESGRRNEALLAALCLFATSMLGGGLGALMALAGSPWYASYAAMGLTPFGVTPLADQQLAGLVMWVPGGLFHLAAALFALRLALAQPQKVSTIA